MINELRHIINHMLNLKSKLCQNIIFQIINVTVVHILNQVV